MFWGFFKRIISVLLHCFYSICGKICGIFIIIFKKDQNSKSYFGLFLFFDPNEISNCNSYESYKKIAPVL